MVMFLIGLAVGLFVAAPIVVFALAVCRMASRDLEPYE